MFVYQYTKIAYAMCDLNQNMKQKKQKKKQKKQKKILPNRRWAMGTQWGLKFFMKLHHYNFCTSKKLGA